MSLAAGDSGTPLTRKLGIREGARVALVGAPPGFEAVVALDADWSGLRFNRRAGATR